MREMNVAHALFSLFVSSEQAETIEGDLLEENGDNRLLLVGNVVITVGALLIHQLRQTPMPVFILCITCIMFLKILEMLGMYLTLFVFGFNTAPLASALSILSVAIVASTLAVVTCLRWVPGFNRPQVAVTASMLLIYVLVNCGVIIALAGSAGSNAVGAAGKLMFFETLFHILPILFAGLRYGKNIAEQGSRYEVSQY